MHRKRQSGENKIKPQIVEFIDFVALLKADFKLVYWLFKKYLPEQNLVIAVAKEKEFIISS